MNPWIAKALVLAGTVVMIAIRAPHGHRSRIVKVATSYKTPRETGLLVLAWVGFFVPLIWVASPAFSFAEYPLRTGPLVAGVMCLVIGLWLFRRSGPRDPKLGGRSLERGRVRGPLCASRRRGGENDGRAIWRRLRGVLGTDEASCPWPLVDNTERLPCG